MDHGRQGLEVLQRAGGRLRVDEGHGIHRRAPQRVAQHVRFHHAPERHVEAHAVLAAGAHQVREPFAEGAVDEAKGPVPHPVPDRQFHEPRGGRRADEHQAGRLEQAGERRL